MPAIPRKFSRRSMRRLGSLTGSTPIVTLNGRRLTTCGSWTSWVCTVTAHRSISWRGRRWFISRGSIGQPVAVRPTPQDGLWQVYFCQRLVASIDLATADEV